MSRMFVFQKSSCQDFWGSQPGCICSAGLYRWVWLYTVPFLLGGWLVGVVGWCCHLSNSPDIVCLVHLVKLRPIVALCVSFSVQKGRGASVWPVVEPEYIRSWAQWSRLEVCHHSGSSPTRRRLSQPLLHQVCQGVYTHVHTHFHNLTFVTKLVISPWLMSL